MENTTKCRILLAEMKCCTDLFALQNNHDMSISVKNNELIPTTEVITASRLVQIRDPL